jgi:hypothetical protein
MAYRQVVHKKLFLTQSHLAVIKERIDLVVDSETAVVEIRCADT